MHLSCTTKNHIRASDLAALYGGEALLLIFPKTNQDVAVLLAENLRFLTQPVEFNEVVRITISLGARAYRDTDTLDSMLKRVDKALYNAKEAGLNRVERF